MKVPDGLDGCRRAVDCKDVDCRWRWVVSSAASLYHPPAAREACEGCAARTQAASPISGVSQPTCLRRPTELHSATRWPTILSYHRKTLVRTAPINEGAAASSCCARTSQRMRLCQQQTGTLASASQSAGRVVNAVTRRYLSPITAVPRSIPPLPPTWLKGRVTTSRRSPSGSLW